MKLNKILIIVGIVLISVGGACFIAGAILSILGQTTIGDLCMGLSGLFGLLALGALIFRLVNMSKTPELYQEERPKVVVKIVDVKEVPKTNEQKLYEQYEDLYKRNLITKEELDSKRIELLGK